MYISVANILIQWKNLNKVPLTSERGYDQREIQLLTRLCRPTL
jgi:hypothetical protein